MGSPLNPGSLTLYRNPYVAKQRDLDIAIAFFINRGDEILERGELSSSLRHHLIRGIIALYAF